MATQTPTQRSATAKRGAATRKRNAAKRSATTTRSSARRTTGSASNAARGARGTARSAGTTATHGAETVARSVEAAGTQLGVATMSARRVLYTTVGAVATAGDAVKRSALAYKNPVRLAGQLQQFERRGARVLDRGRGNVRGRVL